MKYWLTSGWGQSSISRLLAYDAMLKNAGIGFQNIVPVSSIPPITEAKVEIDRAHGITYVYLDENTKKLIPASTVLFVVQALKYGTTGEDISACIGLAKISFSVSDVKIESLLAYEETGYHEEEVQRNAVEKVKALAAQKNAEIDFSWGNDGMKTICSSLRVKDKFGCVGAFVVFDPFTISVVK